MQTRPLMGTTPSDPSRFLAELIRAGPSGPARLMRLDEAIPVKKGLATRPRAPFLRDLPTEKGRGTATGPCGPALRRGVVLVGSKA